MRKNIAVPIMAILVIASYVASTWLPNETIATAQPISGAHKESPSPAKQAQKWEYAEMEFSVWTHKESGTYSFTISWSTAKDFKSAKKDKMDLPIPPWEELYNKLGGEKKNAVRLDLYALVGEHGWELVSHTKTINQWEGSQTVEAPARSTITSSQRPRHTQELWIFKRPKQ